MRATAQAFGQHVGPDDAYLGLSRLRPRGGRLRAHEAGALAVARWLETRPEVARVLHPALPSCPGHALWARDYRGSSGLFSLVLSGGVDAARDAMIDGLEHFGIGFSWGGYESLAVPINPAPVRSATRWQAEGPALRLHIGLEHPDDLIADLANGLDRFRAGLS